MKKTINPVDAGIERTSNELRATTIKTASGTRTEMLPSDPYKVAALLKERRNKPAGKARARMAAEAAKRGI